MILLDVNTSTVAWIFITLVPGIGVGELTMNSETLLNDL